MSVAQVAEMVDTYATLVGRAQGLLAADRGLEHAEGMIVDATGEEADSVRARIYELRGIIRRDNFAPRAATGYFDRGRAIALKRRDLAAATRFSMASATSYNIVGASELEWLALRQAFADLRRAGVRRHPDLTVEFLARTATHLADRGDRVQAYALYQRSIVPRSRAHESTGLVSARLTGMVRLHLLTHGRPSAASDRWLDEAEREARTSGSGLREMQWRTARARSALLDGEVDAAEAQTYKVRDLLAVGQFRNRHADALFRHFEIPVQETHREDETIVVFYNNQGPVAIGSQNVSQTVVFHNDASLVAQLREAGLDDGLIDELRGAVAADAAESAPTDRPGPHVRRWLAKLSVGATSTAGKIGVGASGALIARIVAAHFGWQ